MFIEAVAASAAKEIVVPKVLEATQQLAEKITAGTQGLEQPHAPEQMQIAESFKIGEGTDFKTDTENRAIEELREKTFADRPIEGTRQDEAFSANQIETINNRLEGSRHPVTDVPFERKVINDGAGNCIEGVFPDFNSPTPDVMLPHDLLKETDAKQFDFCNEKLAQQIESNPELKDKFTKEQLEQISNGDTPDGYSWHHHEEPGKMKLVDLDIHAKTGHTGGKAIWGGGATCR